MKTATVLIAIGGLVASIEAQYFACVAARSGAPFHLSSLTAAGERIYLGGTSANYCPSEIQEQGGCPDTTSTNFAGGNGYVDWMTCSA